MSNSQRHLAVEMQCESNMWQARYEISILCAMNYAQCGISKTRRPIKRGRLYTRRRIERTGADMA